MNAEKVKNKVIKSVKNDPWIITEICDAIRDHSGFKGELPWGLPDEECEYDDDDAEDKAFAKYAVSVFKKVPAKHFDEAELHIEAIISESQDDTLEDLEDLLDLDDKAYERKILSDSSRMPEIKTNSSTSKIVS